MFFIYLLVKIPVILSVDKFKNDLIMTYLEAHKIFSKSLCRWCLILCSLEFHDHKVSKSYTVRQIFYTLFCYLHNALLIYRRILNEYEWFYDFSSMNHATWNCNFILTVRFTFSGIHRNDVECFETIADHFCSVNINKVIPIRALMLVSESKWMHHL